MNIHYLNRNLNIKADPAKTLLDNILEAGIDHPHACGGKAKCSTCRVFVQEGLENCKARNEAETAIALKLGFIVSLRLACQTFVKGDVSVKSPLMDEIDISLADHTLINSREYTQPQVLGKDIMVSAVFCDIENYTSFAESQTSYDVIHILNRYFYYIGLIIKEFSGHIIDYFGDGFLAIFGLDDNPDHAEMAVKASLKIQEVINREFNHYLKQSFNSAFKLRIGIHSGPVIYGTIGVEGMQKMTAIGDTINLASRLEQANKTLGTKFLVSETTYQQLENLSLQAIGNFEIEVKGKKGSYRVYQIA
ncbi:MAG: adenylate/guanylate cyclase domain-containing protein [Candidatus Cyclobacteriaceae bacterium M3_2C_046]